MEHRLTLYDILSAPESFPWNYSLYMIRGNTWSLSSLIVVSDPDELDDSVDAPPEAISDGMEYILGIASVQDIVTNARQQKPNCSPDDLLHAFMYYVTNDAFITFG